MISKYKLRVCQLEQISGWTNPAAFTACTAQTDQLSFIQLTTSQISLLPPEFNRSTNHTQQIMKKTVSLDGNARHLSNCCFLSLIETLVFYSFVTLQTAVCQIMIHTYIYSVGQQIVFMENICCTRSITCIIKEPCCTKCCCCDYETVCLNVWKAPGKQAESVRS